MDASSLSNWMSTLLNAGFAGFMAYYLLRHAIPAIQRQFSDDLRQQREDFKVWRENDQKALDRLVNLIVGNQIDKLETIGKRLEDIALRLAKQDEAIESISESTSRHAEEWRKAEDRWREKLTPGVMLEVHRKDRQEGKGTQP